ncbi:hypothetical protein ALC60_06315 [Trachymyrmex zeteki]|uniref:Uncharacterized protein n=1 Tax=Mycetomoellerius zeteki TaxID=64791 RepID=A0A151X3L9_9HYME|nr:hypothetical protein ALC60_06315 [Trachymyrmex zeteki]
MDTDTFEFLLEKVTPLIKKQNTHLRESILPNERLSVTLRHLATENVEDMRDICKEEEVKNNENFGKYKRENYGSSNESDRISCYRADLSASAGF